MRKNFGAEKASEAISKPFLTPHCFSYKAKQNIMSSYNSA
jgi:hypothetical protein